MNQCMVNKVNVNLVIVANHGGQTVHVKQNIHNE